MRVLIVDNDSEMLENVARRLRDGFSIDIVTGKGDALDLLRQNDLHVVVACEQLTDGSGLDLLSQTAKRWPETLRLFAASADRIALLRGRLGPFKLFQTLTYPIDPGELGSILMLAQAAQAAHADTANVQHIVLGEDRSSQAETPASVLARASMNAPPSLAVTRGAARPMPFTVSSPAPARGASPAAAPAAAPAAQRKPLTRESLAAVHRPAPPAGVPTAPVARRAPMRRPIPKAADVLPALAQLRSRLHGRPASHQPQRKQLVLVAVVLGALTVAASAVWLSAGGSDEPRADRQTSSAQARAAAADPVIRVVEAALAADNVARAKKALRRLHTIAPEHERLAFLEALVKRREALGRALTAAKASAIAQPTPVESPAEPSGAAPDPGTEAVELAMPEAGATVVTVEASTFASLPATDSAGISAPAETSAPAPPAPPAQTFAGRTLETSTSPAGKGARGAAPPDERPGLPLARDATLVKRVEPEYPREAAARGTQGFVEIAFTVTAAGSVANTVIMQGAPPGVFDREALNAIRQWRYEPRIENGLPVNWNTLVRMEFKLGQ